MWHEWGEKRNVYMSLVRNPKGKRQLGTSIPKSVDNITKDFDEVRRGGVD
jgi:hypothetical protein